MKAQYQLTLDGVGCLSLVVLTGAIHWFLASRFPERGAGLGALLWIASIVLGLVVVARAVGRDAARAAKGRVAKLAAAPCPWCGAPIGAERASAMAERAKERAGGPWAGECGACGEGIAFDPETGSVTR